VDNNWENASKEINEFSINQVVGKYFSTLYEQWQKSLVDFLSPR
jgi:hypothetical protein